ncbi:MAG: hypothetical protein ACOYEV_04610 [Candidatus Nanopelagicales bacterium]
MSDSSLPTESPRTAPRAQPDAIQSDGILLHAGFHKTGTTALQSSLQAVREELPGFGVCYPGERRSHHRSAMAVTERVWGWGERGAWATPMMEWDKVADQATSFEGRVVISSEAFALADTAALDRIVADLGADRLHVVFTLRPMAKLLASSWQQYLKFGLALPIDQWLRDAFDNRPECVSTPNFWVRNDHSGNCARWVERLGPEHVTLVIPDDDDHSQLYRDFEALLGLPRGMLIPDTAVQVSNRSVTAAEAELLRLVNAGSRKRWEWRTYEKLVRRGAASRMVEQRAPQPDEPRVVTPQWALDAAAEHGAATIAEVRRLGIKVVGPLETLGASGHGGDPTPGAALVLPVGAGAEAVLGTLSAAMAGQSVAPPTDDDVNVLLLPAVRRMTKGQVLDLAIAKLSREHAFTLADQLLSRAQVLGLAAGRLSRAQVLELASQRLTSKQIASLANTQLGKEEIAQLALRHLTKEQILALSGQRLGSQAVEKLAVEKLPVRRAAGVLRQRIGSAFSQRLRPGRAKPLTDQRLADQRSAEQRPAEQPPAAPSGEG